MLLRDLKCSSFEDPEEAPGLAHFLEHMVRSCTNLLSPVHKGNGGQCGVLGSPPAFNCL